MQEGGAFRPVDAGRGGDDSRAEAIWPKRASKSGRRNLLIFRPTSPAQPTFSGAFGAYLIGDFVGVFLAYRPEAKSAISGATPAPTAPQSGIVRDEEPSRPTEN